MVAYVGEDVCIPFDVVVVIVVVSNSTKLVGLIDGAPEVMALDGAAVGSLVTTMVGTIVGESKGVAEGCCDVEEVGDALGNEKLAVAFDPLINAPKVVVVVVVVVGEVEGWLVGVGVKKFVVVVVLPNRKSLVGALVGELEGELVGELVGPKLGPWVNIVGNDVGILLGE